MASAPPSVFPSREIVVDTGQLHTGAALADRLEAAGYPGPFSVDGVSLRAADPLGSGLTDGATIVCGALPGPGSRAQVPHLVFVVHSGPDAGQVIPLTRGSYTIGRASCDIEISDPALSRRHALLTVGEDAVLLEDLESANGTFVDGEAVGSADITVAVGIRLGSSRCRVELVDDHGRHPGIHEEVLEPLPVGPDMPRKPPRILILTAVLPLVLGVVLALTTGMWFFLAFSALSAVTGLVPLLTHRRSARVFADAVRDTAEADRRRRILAVPDPGETALDALRARYDPTGRLPPRPRSSPDTVLLRLGTADQPANLSVRGDTPFTPPILEDLPLVLPCPSGAEEESFTITGEAGPLRRLLHALLLQVSHPLHAAPSVICWGSAQELPRHARFLPNVRLTKDPRVLASCTQQAGLLLIFQLSDDLPAFSRRPGVVVVRFREGPGSSTGSAGDSGPSGPGLTIAAGGARARIGGREYPVHPDGVSARTFERTARTLARAAATSPALGWSHGPGPVAPAEGVLPRSATLWSDQLLPGTLAMSIPGRWAHSDAAHPSASVGRSASGAVSIDLVGDGPHLLVAGTTGSGKSEFLRSLVLGLALDQPPEHLALLLIDYKGGSGLTALSALPHCVGILTDLSSESAGRFLVSLRAELRRREQLCAQHGTQDLDGLRRASPRSCPPRLVVVIDEFRMLSDDVPTAMSDLMKVAALGRSLGVHLVLATQRAQGVVTPDLRANLTTSVLLRVQTALESQDLLGSAAAADIPIDAPGRAFLRKGAGAPIAFQVASASVLPSADDSPGWQDFDSYLDDEAVGAPPGGSAPSTPAGDVLEQAVAGLTAAAGGAAASHPFRPVLPPLPEHLPAAACSRFQPVGSQGRGQRNDGGSTLRAVPLGVADFPDRQAQRLLCWEPGDHGHLALVGLPGSGVSGALASVMASLPGAAPDVHLYVLDGDGSLQGCSRAPQVGAYVRSHETRRAARVLERLAAMPLGTEDAHHTVLAITGWGRWGTQFRNGRFGRAEEDLHGLVRDGAHSGLSVLMAGDRELTASRFFALMPNRVYLPLGAHQETTLTWPKMPPIEPVTGRGLAQGRITGSWGDGVCQLVTEPCTDADPVRPPALTPFRVHPLPRLVPLQQVQAAAQGGAGNKLLLGVHGDDLEPFSVPLRPGEVYLVLGHAASGRTNALRVLQESAGRRHTVLAPPRDADGIDAAGYWRGLASRPAGRMPREECILVVDDADQLPVDVQQVLSGLVGLGAAAVLSAAPGPALMSRVPLSLQARGTGRGLVLSPRAPTDGDFFGVRLEAEGPPIAGRGYACEPSGVVEVQVARAAIGHADDARTGPGG
ncbi:FtsK/SpoIIIE domain-containing protein [Arthrobacter sp. NPDC092385]|uniref:FtsK/SpoIIIE domain-containing protein n=1 Tax=Arthrobacter sp. NPDC092385 TaxID=3363943 RepID=UPI0038091660